MTPVWSLLMRSPDFKRPFKHFAGSAKNRAFRRKTQGGDAAAPAVNPGWLKIVT